MSNLSGKEWWHANQGKYPNSSEIEALEDGFKDSVASFVKALREGGANVNITSTLRNPKRAYLMHFSWKVANEEVDYNNVPAKEGVDINWNHGNKELSVKAAKEMVSLFNLAYCPSLTSNHIKGKAIDMTIRWKDNLFIGPVPNQGFVGITDGPRNGAKNRELHAIGEQYGVFKLLNDAPHWSYNGR